MYRLRSSPLTMSLRRFFTTWASIVSFFSVAAQYTPNVVKVYSPDATWPAVKQALRGASVVVYLGHGNGWPSRYRDELTPSTQNGMGLNPNAGAGDTHQYCGEDRVGSEIKLAKQVIGTFEAPLAVGSALPCA
mgnify:CR=1 FL=1